MSSKTQHHEEAMHVDEGKSGLWGFLAGLVVAAFIMIPLSGAFAFATHPSTQQLFSGRLDETSQGGYTAFWWIVTIFLVALPFLVGYAVAHLSVKTLSIVGGIIVIFIIAALVFGQLFLVV
ncbi:hypothetical protein [Agromyces sp. Marseille-Q5079]|uniref:hypothetical protein n=1 Tax=Agromyces sp. Marseille-Q5079 TaxID=3439059 RepID=UPI003D9C9FA5